MSSQAVAWAIVMQAGSPSAKAVLMAIANYANEYGECWASQETLAEGAELKVRQLRTIIGHLIERGLIERVRRGGEGRGRHTDLLRLRMRELPAILTAKRRPEPEESNRQYLPVAEQPAISRSNRQSLPAAMEGGATGNQRGGNRQIIAGNPKKPRTQTPLPPGFEEAWALWPKHVRASDKRTSAQRWTKLAQPPEQMLAAVKAYLASPDAQKGGGEYVNAFEVWLSRKAEFWLERVASGGADDRELERRLMLWRHDRTWHASWGPPPDDQLETDLFKTGART